MVIRAEPRDFIDVAAAMAKFSEQELISLGQRADPALSTEELVDAMRRLDRLDDVVFETLYNLSPDQVAELRGRFAGWPRS